MINLPLFALTADDCMGNGGNKESIQVLQTTKQPSTLKIVMYAGHMLNAQKPGILVTWSQLGLSTLHQH